MACSLTNISLDPTAKGETFNGFTISLVSDADDTEFADTLERIRMSWVNSSGTAVLTKDSENSGEITINVATARLWSFTVEPAVLNITDDFYSFYVETTDSGGVINKDFMTGTHEVTKDPHS